MEAKILTQKDADLLNRKEVVIEINHAGTKTPTKLEVVKKGRLIEGDALDLIRFKVRTFKEYTDTAKFRRAREEFMMKKHV